MRDTHLLANTFSVVASIQCRFSQVILLVAFTLRFHLKTSSFTINVVLKQAQKAGTYIFTGMYMRMKYKHLSIREAYICVYMRLYVCKNMTHKCEHVFMLCVQRSSHL